MDEEQLKAMAAQLRKPEGEPGIKTGEWMNTGNLQINLDTLRALDAGKNDAILEIGMGNGFFVKQILSDNPHVTYTGCDFSEIMIEEAKKLNKEWLEKGQATFINANASLLPFESETFDKLFTINTIYFWEDERVILNELKRVLKPGGILIIALRSKHQMMHYPFIKYGFNTFSKEDVSSLLISSGFSVSQVIENKEPDFDLNGEVMKMENLVVIAGKH